MLILILLYLSCFSAPWNAVALPANLQSSQDFPTNHLQSMFIREEDSRFDSRSIYNILWSCLSTIFTCTWIAVHPNIPAPGDSQWRVFRRRVAIMGYVLLLPELVIYWAWRQHKAVRDFVKKHHENTGWTPVHAFFLIMGGFTLYKEGKPVRVLEVKDLEELSKAGKVEWPTITKEEIADRSKGDYLSKTIVLFQTTWFIGQCISRGAYGLAVTELEVVTLAFAALNGIIYYFWWNKPLDVRCSIPVQLLGDDVEKPDTHLHSISGQRVQEGDENVVVVSNPPPSTSVQYEQKILVTNPKSLPPISIQVDTSTPNPDPALTRMQRLQNFIRRACAEHGTLLGLGYVFRYPFARFFSSLFDLSNCDTLKDKILRVPTFYSPPNNLSDDHLLISNIYAMCVSIIFGAIHCIAWSFHFATLQERWAWRISAVLVLGLPIPYVAILEVGNRLYRRNQNIWMVLYMTALVAILSLYIIARITLLILPFTGLRALPPGAYVQINWVNFLPHI